MESWCFDSLDKGYVSNETISASDAIIRSKNVLMGWDFKAPFSYENRMLVPNQESGDDPGFPEVGIGEMIKKQFPHDSTRNVVNNDGGVGDIVSPSLVTSNGASGDEESSSKLSSSVVDSSSRESSLIDLKLGGFCENQKANAVITAPSSAESSRPVKRVRATSLSSQTVYCQVYGCQKDLSSAKDYHKRHKVCDVHSKTNKVVVNGIEQRFCQQCSRFHLLGEFDDGKRSCRKRLAGHNERRRKPQVGLYSSRNGRSFQSYTGSAGSKFEGTTLTATSFVCQDILPRDASHTEKYGTNGWGRHVKIEDGADCAPNLADTSMDRHNEKSIMSPFLLRKPYHSVDSLNNTGSECAFGKNAQFRHEMVSRSLYQTNSLGSEDVTLFDAASTVQGLPGISEAGCALSLLSSQSLNSPGHSSRMLEAHPLIIPSNSPHYSVSAVSEKLLEVSSQGVTSEVHNRVPSYRVNYTGRNNLSALSVLNDGDTANSDFGNGLLQGSELTDVKNRLSGEDGTTINLLQLSSQLQRVEHQRQSAPVRQEPESFCSLRMT